MQVAPSALIVVVIREVAELPSVAKVVSNVDVASAPLDDVTQPVSRATHPDWVMESHEIDPGTVPSGPMLITWLGIIGQLPEISVHVWRYVAPFVAHGFALFVETLDEHATMRETTPTMKWIPRIDPLNAFFARN